MPYEVPRQLFDLHGKVAIVAGDGSSISREVACVLGQSGAAVIVAGVAMDHGHRTVEYIRALGGEAGFVTWHPHGVDSFRALVDHTLGEYGRVDLFDWVGTIETTDETTDESASETDRDLVSHVGDCWGVLRRLTARQGSEASALLILDNAERTGSLERDLAAAFEPFEDSDRFSVNTLVRSGSQSKDAIVALARTVSYLAAVGASFRGNTLWL
jgi:NAD(P)-dependent dehydrogenase (short-subunit alcohol dehydrogenase family)